MRADRLLSILLLLQAHGRMTGRALAKRLEVSERTIHRDMESLGAAGFPVVAERGSGGGWSLMEGYRTQLTGLSESEVQALFVTKPSRLLADLQLDKASDAALIKLLTVLPSVYRRNAEVARQRIYIDVSGWHRSSERVPLLPLLQDAVWHERRVRMQYGEADCAVERLVDPLGLVAKGSVWYLVAAIAGDVRSYRVSRVQEATMTEDPFVRPEGFDLETFWQQSAARFQQLMPRYHVVIRAEASSMQWIRALMRFGAIDEVTPDERDGSNRIAMHFDAPEVARAFLLGLGDAAEVIEPPELRASVREAAQRLINRYEGRTAAADRAPTAS